ncbi:AAA family ATPase [Proteobacteria bacterium 005FR1]|nr:AAA family ATPase [Proteobacteria bacterium 005FR1]
MGDEGLDYVLRGGLPRNAMYLLQGQPGSGKTTLALQFLLAGAKLGNKGMYVTLSETREEITRVAESHGWSLESLELFELSSFQEVLESTAGQSMFHPAEVELVEVTRPILDEVDRLKPSLVVIDSLSEIRLLSGELLRFRRQVLALKQFFAARQCTVLLLDDRTADIGSALLESLAHGVITLERESPTYGRTHRRISIDKLRGVAMREGYHDFRIETGGAVTYPRLVAADHPGRAELTPLPSGIEELDTLLKGGTDRGTNTLLIGPSGVGKSSVATQYALAAAERGEHAAIFLFDETVDTVCARAASLGMPLGEHLDSGLITIRQLDPAELTAGEFSHAVRQAATRDGAKVVVIDSLNGFMDSVPDERFISMHLRELLTYLNHKGVATLTVLAQHGLLGDVKDSTLDVSYLADNVILFRYFEATGEVRRAISVLKKRSGPHERTIREFILGENGITIGAPILEFHGVLTGTPTFVGDNSESLLKKS